MRSFLICALSLAAFTACSDDSTKTPDAPMGGGDLTCANYCGKIMANCTAANAQFDDMDKCLQSCAKYPMGAVADTSGNTLGCRLYHAGNAATTPDVHCRHAGPGGDGVCGMNCDGFCGLVQAVCSAQATPPYANMAACTTACAGFATTPAYSSTVTNGNSLACRLYHATNASKSAMTAMMHCPHTAMASATCQ